MEISPVKMASLSAQLKLASSQVENAFISVYFKRTTGGRDSLHPSQNSLPVVKVFAELTRSASSTPQQISNARKAVRDH